MEFITLTNHVLLEGNFELDLSDGEVRFKTSLHVTDDRDLDLGVVHMLAINLAVFALYGGAFSAAADGTAIAIEALQAAEQR